VYFEFKNFQIENFHLNLLSKLSSNEHNSLIMANKDQQVNYQMNNQLQNGLNTSNQSKHGVVLHPNKSSNQHSNNSSYNGNKNLSGHYSSMPSNQQKPFKKKGYLNNYNFNSGYQNGHHYNNNGYNNKYNSNYMSTKSHNKNSNYHHRYNNQQTTSQSSVNNSNLVELKYDSAGNSNSNSVTPPSNSTNTTASPSNLESPGSLSVSTNNISNTNESSTATDKTVTVVNEQQPQQQQPQTEQVVEDNNNDKLNDIQSSSKVVEIKSVKVEPQLKIESKTNEQSTTPIESLNANLPNNLVRELSNLSINVNHGGGNHHISNAPSSAHKQSTTHQTHVTSLNEKNAHTGNNNYAMSFNKSGHQQQHYYTYSNNNSVNNHHRSPHSPQSQEQQFGSMMINSSTNNGSRHTQSKLTHYNNNSNSNSNYNSINNQLNGGSNNNSYQSSFQNNNNKLNYSTHPRGGGKKTSQQQQQVPQQPTHSNNVHLLNNNNNQKSNQAIITPLNQSNLVTNANSGYLHMKMNNNLTHLSQQQQSQQLNKMIPNANLQLSQNHHTQMIPQNASLFYNHPSMINHLNPQTQPHLQMPCYIMGGQCAGQLPNHTAYHPAYHTAPYNQAAALQPQQLLSAVNLHQQPRVLYQETSAETMNRPNQKSQQQAAIHLNEKNPYTGNHYANAINTTANVVQPIQFEYSSYYLPHFIQPNHYLLPNYHPNQQYAMPNNESQLNYHQALINQQNTMNQMNPQSAINANNQSVVMNPSAVQQQQQQITSSSSGIEIPSNISAENSRSNSAYEASTVHPFYATGNTALLDHNQMIWPQQQNPNNHLSQQDFLSSHKQTLGNTYTETGTGSNLVNSDNNTILVDKK